jgi:parallel beta-helix repeat protein
MWMIDQQRRLFVLRASQLTASVGLWAVLPFVRASEQTSSRVTVDRQAAGLAAGADCTALLQDAIDKLPSTGGDVIVPAGDYVIDAVKSVSLRSNVNLRLLPGAVLRAKPNAASNYAILRIRNASNVSISGGNVIGDRDQHLGTAGEWGMGVDIRGSHTVLLDGVHISKCWGDGIYVGSATGTGSGTCSDITLRQVVSEKNRRQGLSIVACSGALIEQCEFNDTNGTAPAAGIDLEPNAGEIVENVRIINCVARGNQGDGFQFYAEAAGALLRSNTIEGGVSSGNGRYGVRLRGASNCVITNVQITDNANYGVYVQNNARDCTISSNKVTGNLREVAVQSTVMKILHGGDYGDIKIQDGAQNIKMKSNETGK